MIIKNIIKKKLAKFAEDLEQVIKLIIFYNPEQDGISERSIDIFCEKIRTVIIDLNIPIFL